MAEFNPQAMDNAADEAEEELNTLDAEAVNLIANWWYKWFMQAGHKRLGRILVQMAKEMEDE